MITVRILPPADFAKRKAELEQRDGTVVPPELMAIAKRLIWKTKVRKRAKVYFQERRKK